MLIEPSGLMSPMAAIGAAVWWRKSLPRWLPDGGSDA